MVSSSFHKHILLAVFASCAGYSVIGVRLDEDSANGADCSNVKDWNFAFANVSQNNLGGLGPDQGKKEIRYAGVSDGMDLILTTDATYVVNPKVKTYDSGWAAGKTADGTGNNGINGKFGQVNVKGNSNVKMIFTLVEADTDTPVEISPNQKVFFSVFDLDNYNGKEFVDFTTPVDSYRATSTTTAKITGNNAHLQATGGRTGNDEDNPSDPLAMTQVQKDSAIWVTYIGRNTWGMTFGETGNTKQKGGRNLLFAGRAEGDCAPGPVVDPPGFCTAGIEGMIKGGGKVCCPDKCGFTLASGEPTLPKFSGAPNSCGGPACDKGPDGQRQMERYNDCCVGKPIVDGNVRASINASYGIVSKGRFCTGLGTDAPPCINRLSKQSDR
jgi:hypothetical protein